MCWNTINIDFICYCITAEDVSKISTGCTPKLDFLLMMDTKNGYGYHNPCGFLEDKLFWSSAWFLLFIFSPSLRVKNWRKEGEKKTHKRGYDKRGKTFQLIPWSSTNKQENGYSISICAHTHRPTDTLRGFPGAGIGRETKREGEHFFPTPPQPLQPTTSSPVRVRYENRAAMTPGHLDS